MAVNAEQRMKSFEHRSVPNLRSYSSNIFDSALCVLRDEGRWMKMKWPWLKWWFILMCLSCEARSYSVKT